MTQILFTFLVLFPVLFPLLAAAQDSAGPLTQAERRQGFRPLFDGQTLNGWDGAPGLWTVQDGVLVGSTHGHKLAHNSFLISKEEFSDFILRIDVKLENHNSGIQFRSKALPEWVVSGYQADAAEGAWWGSLYGEKTGRGVIAPGYRGKGEKVVRPGGWNHYEIICKGKRITLTLNHLVTVDIDDAMAASGILALQLHAGPPMRVSFRNIRIRELE